MKQGKNYENFLSSLGTKVILQDSKNNWEREQTNFGPATTEDPWDPAIKYAARGE